MKNNTTSTVEIEATVKAFSGEGRRRSQALCQPGRDSARVGFRGRPLHDLPQHEPRDSGPHPQDDPGGKEG